MNSMELIKEVEEILQQMMKILKKKNNDYADDNDCFSNFKFCSEVAGIPVEKVFMVLLAVKIARLKELLKNKTPLNESFEDTLIDMANYSILMAIYLKEKDNEV